MNNSRLIKIRSKRVLKNKVEILSKDCYTRNVTIQDWIDKNGNIISLATDKQKKHYVINKIKNPNGKEVIDQDYNNKYWVLLKNTLLILSFLTTTSLFANPNTRELTTEQMYFDTIEAKVIAYDNEARELTSKGDSYELDAYEVCNFYNDDTTCDKIFTEYDHYVELNTVIDNDETIAMYNYAYEKGNK